MSNGDKPSSPSETAGHPPQSEVAGQQPPADTTGQGTSQNPPAAESRAAAESDQGAADSAEQTAAKEASPAAADQPSSGDAPEGGPSQGTEPSQGAGSPKGTGPLARAVRGGGPLAARGLGVAKPASPRADQSAAASQKTGSGDSGKQGGPGAGQGKGSGQGGKGAGKGKSAPRPRLAGEKSGQSGSETPSKPAAPPSKVAVPNRRHALPEDIQAELDAELAAADVEGILSGAAGMPDRREPLEEGARVQGQVLKVHDDSVFVALGGPDEGAVPLEQFADEPPQAGQTVEVMVRGFNSEDGLYALTLPGRAVEVSDWEDLEEGSVVEATVTGSNSGGLECKVGNLRGFMPISQVAEYRVEDLSEFTDQKMVCLVTEANPRRGNLVLSRRAILEREREARREEQLETIEAGDTLEGTVRSVKDFGAFVDLGGLDGLIHISKLSWERVKHPSDVLEEGQKVKVKIDKVDKQTGKISLSYRDLLENPWDTAESDFAVGTVHRGTVTRIANFGCFVRLSPGVEGLVHISELAHHRVSKVSAFVSEGDEVDVKVLSFDRQAQKIGLSIKQAQSIGTESEASQEAEQDEPQREPAVRASHSGPLKGGNNRETGGERFGLRW